MNGIQAAPESSSFEAWMGLDQGGRLGQQGVQ